MTQRQASLGSGAWIHRPALSFVFFADSRPVRRVIHRTPNQTDSLEHSKHTDTHERTHHVVFQAARRPHLAAAALLTAAATASAHASETYTITPPDAVAEGAGLTAGNSISVTTVDESITVVSVSAVSLQSGEGNYLVAEDGGGDDANCDRTAIGSWEKLLRVDFSDGTTAFRSVDGYYLRAVNGGGSGAEFASTVVDTMERFTVDSLYGTTVSLETANGYYVVAEGGGGGDLNANRTAVGSWEKFTLIDLGASFTDATPELVVRFADMDGDGDEEMMLFVEQNDGTGYFIVDPMGIADTMNTMGYKPTSDLFQALSNTQRQALGQQANAVGNFGNFVSGNELRTVISAMGDGVRSYLSYEYEFVLEGAIGEDSLEYGEFSSTVAVGSYTIMVEDGDLGTPNFELSANAAQLTGSVGGVVTVTVTGASVAAILVVNADQFTVAGGAELISVNLAVGNEDGTYAAVRASVGVGFYADIKAGANGQYGFTLDLPVFPISVAIYVSGDDVETVGEAVADFAASAYNTTEDFAAYAWTESSSWIVDNSADVIVTISDTGNDTFASIQKTSDKFVIVASDSADAMLSVLDDASDAIGDVITSIGTAFEDLGDGITTVVSDVSDTFDDAVSWFVSLF